MPPPEKQACAMCQGPVRYPPVMTEDGHMPPYGLRMADSLTISTRMTVARRPGGFTGEQNESRRYCPPCTLIVKDALMELGFEFSTVAIDTETGGWPHISEVKILRPPKHPYGYCPRPGSESVCTCPDDPPIDYSDLEARVLATPTFYDDGPPCNCEYRSTATGRIVHQHACEFYLWSALEDSE